ncbi:MAG: hypothetical protein JOS17DRAFT_794066 [Linnemannia elongata]|nr:MAG: hypothetical protein JOS17DRAFT_794066 [Linnemannia elongata]
MEAGRLENSAGVVEGILGPRADDEDVVRGLRNLGLLQDVANTVVEMDTDGFRLNDLVLNFAVRQDDDGPPYSQLTDVQEAFPTAMLFNLMKYEPKRIAHYPNDIIDIIAGHVLESACPHVPLSSTARTQTNTGNQSHQSQSFSTQVLDLSVSNLSLKPLPHIISSAFVPVTSQPLSSSSALSNLVTVQTASIVRPMAVLSTMALDITQLHQQLEHTTDQQSVSHQQQMQQLVNMVAQPNEMVSTTK